MTHTIPPIRLSLDAIHLPAQGNTAVLPEFGNDYDGYMALYCSPEDPGRLMTLGTTTEDWPVWEVHPAGEEVVVVLSGRAEFIQDVSGVMRHVVLGPNEALVNPPGVPHTANVLEPFTALYITPCPGTQHLPRNKG